MLLLLHCQPWWVMSWLVQTTPQHERTACGLQDTAGAADWPPWTVVIMLLASAAVDMHATTLEHSQLLHDFTAAE